MSDTVETRGLVFRGLAKIYEVLAPWGYTLMRFSAGAVLVYHGYAKLFAGFVRNPTQGGQDSDGRRTAIR